MPAGTPHPGEALGGAGGGQGPPPQQQQQQQQQPRSHFPGCPPPAGPALTGITGGGRTTGGGGPHPHLAPPPPPKVLGPPPVSPRRGGDTHTSPPRRGRAGILPRPPALRVPPPGGGAAPPPTLRQRPDPAGAGGSVSLSPEPLPPAVVSCSWHRAPGADVASEIFTFFLRPALGQQDGPAATGRETGDAGCGLLIRPLRPEDAGPYTLAIRSPAVATATLLLAVHLPLPQPEVTPANVTATENATVTLSCRSPPGTRRVAWLRLGVPLAPGGRLSLSPDNRTLALRPVTRGDAGAFACQVSNALSTNRSHDAIVTVLYGPDAVTVTPPGPLRLPLGARLELLCAAAAAPPPRFAWARGNASLATGSRLRLHFGDPGQAGPYRCRATNPALGRAAEATVVLLRDEGLGSGAVAGIVVGCLLGLGLLVAAGYLLWPRGGRSSPSAPPEGDEPRAYEGPAADGISSTEVTYSTLTFSAAGGAAPHGPPQPHGTVYSEVRQK